MTPKRKFSPRGYVHIFNITTDRGVCFYSSVDCLVWFTLFCRLCIKYQVRVLAVCIMLNHYHFEAWFPSLEVMAAMMRELDSCFTKAYNRQYGRNGPLFNERRYGSALKLKEQKVRENFLYIGNNPVVKKSVSRAEGYRWNFLAYMEKRHPFSKVIPVRESSRALRCVLAEVRRCREQGRGLGYEFFEGVYRQLDGKERQFVMDEIVNAFNVIDYKAVERMWGGFEKMCAALKTAWGAEYDLDDDSSAEDYRHYYQMISMANKMGFDPARAEPARLKERLVRAFIWEVGATKTEIIKMLHLGEDCPAV